MAKSKKIQQQKPKNKREEILIVGKGGDGVVLIGEILGLAATMECKFASQRNNYGPSQRGEALFTEIIIADIPIEYTFIENPTYYISLSQQGFDASYNKLIGEAKKGLRKKNKSAELFIEYTNKYDLHGVDNKFKTYLFETKQAAIENQLPLISNIILLASFIEKSKIVSKESIKKALIYRLSKDSHKQNLKALDVGWKLKSI
jgi:2-oxoglutarate ferredoxin oxidoreductase subunit gamma